MGRTCCWVRDLRPSARTSRTAAVGAGTAGGCARVGADQRVSNNAKTTRRMRRGMRLVYRKSGLVLLTREKPARSSSSDFAVMGRSSAAPYMGVALTARGPFEPQDKPERLCYSTVTEDR